MWWVWRDRGGREGGREEGREGGKEGGREGGREGGGREREGERTIISQYAVSTVLLLCTDCSRKQKRKTTLKTTQEELENKGERGQREGGRGSE